LIELDVDRHINGFRHSIAELISRLAGWSSQTLNGGVREQAFLIIGATVVVLGGINAKAEERPAFERLGFPITQTQDAVLGSAGVRERSPTPTLMLYGMPASPHQVAVLSPRPRSVKKMAPSSLITGLAPATPR
jgi:hypothetical protein